jgi:hypothetical protein
MRELCSDLVLTTFLESWSEAELYIASAAGQLEIAMLHGDLEKIANWVEAPGVQVIVHGANAEIPSSEPADGILERNIALNSRLSYKTTQFVYYLIIFHLHSVSSQSDYK